MDLSLKFVKIMDKIFLNKTLRHIWYIFIIVFGLIVLYQVILKIFEAF